MVLSLSSEKPRLKKSEPVIPPIWLNEKSMDAKDDAQVGCIQELAVSCIYED